VLHHAGLATHPADGGRRLVEAERRLLLLAASQSRLEDLRAVAGVSGVDDHARLR
jgi:hypothetical protein